MTDRVYPSSNPTANGGSAVPDVANGASNQTLPANKGQLYNADRPPYRPQASPRRRNRRGCCCWCCLWMTMLILLIIILAAIAGAVFYVLYRPHRPSFSVTSLQLSRFNLTDKLVISAFNLTVTARNRNSKIAFDYDTMSVVILSDDVDIGGGSIPGFSQGKKNVTDLRTLISSSNTPVPDGTDITALESSFKRKSLPLKIQMETNMKAKIGKINTKKLKVRITCDGIKVSIPSGKTPAVATISKVKCKVDPRIKIIKWTV